MDDVYRISPKNKLVIERCPDPTRAPWYFYKVTDSPNDAKRTLSVLNGDNQLQPELLEDDEQ